MILIPSDPTLHDLLILHLNQCYVRICLVSPSPCPRVGAAGELEHSFGFHSLDLVSFVLFLPLASCFGASGRGNSREEVAVSTFHCLPS